MHACTACQNVSMNARWQARASGRVCLHFGNPSLGTHPAWIPPYINMLAPQVLSGRQRACTRGGCPHFVFSCRQQHGSYILFGRASEHETERCRQRCTLSESERESAREQERARQTGGGRGGGGHEESLLHNAHVCCAYVYCAYVCCVYVLRVCAARTLRMCLRTCMYNCSRARSCSLACGGEANEVSGSGTGKTCFETLTNGGILAGMPPRPRP